MTSLRAVTRLVALALLLFAAGDLLGLGACEDGGFIASQSTALSQSDEAVPTGHQGEECYCCSRTVRSEAAISFTMTTTVTNVVADTSEAFPQRPPRLPYHPPLV